jgi:hypothetical protein
MEEFLNHLWIIIEKEKKFFRLSIEKDLVQVAKLVKPERAEDFSLFEKKEGKVFLYLAKDPDNPNSLGSTKNDSPEFDDVITDNITIRINPDDRRKEVLRHEFSHVIILMQAIGKRKWL